METGEMELLLYSMDVDRAYLFALTTVWDLPVGKGSNSYLLTNPPAWLGYLVNKWSLSGIFAYGTGTPIQLPSTSGFNYIGKRSLKPGGGSTDTQWIWNNGGFPEGCSAPSPVARRRELLQHGFLTRRLVPAINFLRRGELAI
jgi:hypothetical protein